MTSVFEGPEGLGIAKEAGDADEQVGEERVDLRRGLVQVLEVALEGLDLLERHATLDAPVDGARLVLGEVVAGLGAEEDEDLPQDAAGRGGRRGDGAEVPAEGLAGVGEEPGGHLGGGQDVVDQAGGDGAAGHAVELGGGRVLGHDHAALALDGADALGPVAAGAREDDADGALVLVLGQGAEEEVDGQTLSPGRRGLEELEGTVQEGHVAARGDDVRAPGLHRHPVLDLEDGHAGVAADELREEALVVRSQVLHQDEGHRRGDVGRDGGEEGLEGRETPGGGANAHHGEGSRRPLGALQFSVDHDPPASVPVSRCASTRLARPGRMRVARTHGSRSHRAASKSRAKGTAPPRRPGAARLTRRPDRRPAGRPGPGRARPGARRPGSAPRGRRAWPPAPRPGTPPGARAPPSPGPPG